MKDPMMFSLEALLAEEGQFVQAGLPESLRRELDRRKAAQLASELPQDKRERLEQLLASIAEQQRKLRQLQDELHEVLNQFSGTTSNSAPVATPAA
jgi:hypothetical protein